MAGGRPPKRAYNELIEYWNLLYNSKYVYSKIIYQGSTQNIKIICPIHGDFLRTPDAHTHGQGCPKCAEVQRRKTMLENQKKTIIQRFQKIHGTKFDYSKFDYQKNGIKSIVICPIHGEFMITPDAHLHKIGCAKCSRTYNSSQDGKRICEYCEKTFDNLRSLATHKRHCKFFISQKKEKLEKINKNELINLYSVEGYGIEEIALKYNVSRIDIEKELITLELPLRGRMFSSRGKNKIKKVLDNKTIEEKAMIVKKRKATCLKRYGVEDIAKCPDIIEKIKRNSCKGMVSTIANKLFQEIINNLPLDDINQCITHILGKELMIKNDKRHYLLDFTLVLKKKCIEFNGDYFHCNPASFKETFYNSRIKKFAKDIWQADEIKKQAILSCGLELLIVWENDYRKNPQEIVQKCLNFINS